VELRDTDLAALSDGERTRMRRHHIGIVFQRFHLLPSLSARANVALPLVQAGVPRSDRRERATDLLEAVGLGDRTTHLPGELSGGERQRVAIARALSTDPDRSSPTSRRANSTRRPAGTSSSSDRYRARSGGTGGPRTTRPRCPLRTASSRFATGGWTMSDETDELPRASRRGDERGGRASSE